MSDEELRASIARNIAYYRKRSGMTQTELGEKLGYSDKSVSKWERGDGVPDVYVLNRLSELWHIAPGDLLKKDLPKLKLQLSRMVGLLSVGLVCLVTVIAYFVLMLALPNFKLHWLVFIYAIPAGSIVALVFACIRKSRWEQCLYTGGIIWGTALSLQLTLLFAVNLRSGFMFYIIGAVLQVLDILWFLLRSKLKKKS